MINGFYPCGQAAGAVVLNASYVVLDVVDGSSLFYCFANFSPDAE